MSLVYYFFVTQCSMSGLVRIGNGTESHTTDIGSQCQFNYYANYGREGRNCLNI